jgi:broad specificity phosphatase PhoE
MKTTGPTLILVRHGQASLGEADYDRLSPLGHRQSRLVAGRLGRLGQTALVRGEHLRHRQTAAALAADESVVEIEPGLNEYSVQPLLQAAAADAGRLGLQLPPPEAQADPRAFLDVFLALFPAVLDAWQNGQIHCAHNGSWAAFSARVTDAGQRLIERAERQQCVIAFTSAGVISTLTAALLDRDLGWQRQLNVALYNASVTELRYGGGKWHASASNCVEHLPEPGLRSLA